MQRITIGRYKPARPALAKEWHELDGNSDEALKPQIVDAADLYDGWIEGVRDDGTTWILWLDKDGNPEVFWPHRDSDGGVEGESILLAPNPLQSLT